MGSALGKLGSSLRIVRSQVRASRTAASSTRPCTSRLPGLCSCTVRDPLGAELTWRKVQASKSITKLVIRSLLKTQLGGECKTSLATALLKFCCCFHFDLPSFGLAISSLKRLQKVSVTSQTHSSVVSAKTTTVVELCSSSGIFLIPGALLKLLQGLTDPPTHSEADVPHNCLITYNAV